MQAHHKRTNANTASTITTPIAKLPRLSSILISLWWTWPESNRRPEHIFICFIQQYSYLTLIRHRRQDLHLPKLCLSDRIADNMPHLV